MDLLGDRKSRHDTLRSSFVKGAKRHLTYDIPNDPQAPMHSSSESSMLSPAIEHSGTRLKINHLFHHDDLVEQADLLTGKKTMEYDL